MSRRTNLVLSLGDLTLNDEAMANRLERTYFRILGVFRHATEKETRKRVHSKEFPRHLRASDVRSSGNAIVGCGESIEDLAHAVIIKMGTKETKLTVVTAEDVDPQLRKHYRDNNRYRLLLDALAELQLSIVSELLVFMRDKVKAIWFMYERGGTWQMKQSSVDKHAMSKSVSHGLRYLNDHSYHGRPRNQTQRRGIPEGTSIGGRRLRIPRRQDIFDSGIRRTTKMPRSRTA